MSELSCIETLMRCPPSAHALMSRCHLSHPLNHCAFSAKLQKAALDADAVRHLAVLLSKPGRPLGPAPSLAVSGTGTGTASASDRHPPPSSSGSLGGPQGAGGTRPSLQEGVLRALSSLCMDQSDGRKQLVEAKVRLKGARLTGGGVSLCQGHLIHAGWA